MFKRTLALLAAGAIIAGGAAATPSNAAKHVSAPKMTSVMFSQVGTSGVVGDASWMYDKSSNMTTLNIAVKNLEPMSVHPAHIHAGKCGSNGPVLVGLNNVKANAKGNGTSVTKFKGQVPHHAYINVHYGPKLALTQFTVISCVNLM
jgi:hypothetical protein